MDYLFFVIGLALLLVGANYLVDSSVAIAQRARISNFIIGLTVVGMGTSAPELFISVSSAITGHGDVAIGNVVGSNICNILLILGVTATIFPFTIGRDVSRRDIPLGIFAALLLFALCNDSFIPGISENTLSRLDAALLLRSQPRACSGRGRRADSVVACRTSSGAAMGHRGGVAGGARGRWPTLP